jgi:hypothetical protein
MKIRRSRQTCMKIRMLPVVAGVIARREDARTHPEGASQDAA